MYTVVRFCSCDSGDDIGYLGMLLNDRMPGLYEPCDHKDRFSCSLCDSSAWQEHIDAVLTFLKEAVDVLAEAARAGIDVELDTAVFSNDRKGLAAKCVWFDLRLVRALAQHGVSVMFSSYASQAEMSARGDCIGHCDEQTMT